MFSKMTSKDLENSLYERELILGTRKENNDVHKLPPYEFKQTE